MKPAVLPRHGPRHAKLLVVDLRTMRVVQTLSVGADPDVLAFDVGLRRLYVASESGEVAVFVEQGRTLRKLGQESLKTKSGWLRSR